MLVEGFRHRFRRNIENRREIVDGDGKFILSSWKNIVNTPVMAKVIALDNHPRWPRFYYREPDAFRYIAEHYSYLQIVVKDKNVVDSNGEPEVAAMATTNRINWNGRPEDLPASWDAVAGKPKKDYSDTYIKDGNTLCFLAINIGPEYEGKGLAKIVIKRLIDKAKNLKLEHVIAPLRPNGYGEYLLTHPDNQISFKEYCNLTRSDGLPEDSWLRQVVRMGGELIEEAREPVRIDMPRAEFEEYVRGYNEAYPEIKGNNNCIMSINPDGKIKYQNMETGYFLIDRNNPNVPVEYYEPNIWAKFDLSPKKKERSHTVFTRRNRR